MKKLILLFFTTVLVHFCAFAQYSFQVFPIGVVGNPYADTLLNTRAILLAAGIRQIKSYQTKSDLSKTFPIKNVWINKDGQIEKVFMCDEKIPLHCIEDTFICNAAGNLDTIKSKDGLGYNFEIIIIKYISENERESLEISQAKGKSKDSLISYKSYNEKGQLVKLRRLYKGRELQNTSFYYNNDGLLDSTRDSYNGIFIFTSRKKGNRKLIEMKNSLRRCTWVYNESGQCLSYSSVGKYPPGYWPANVHAGKRKANVAVFYNPDGTVSKVTSKSNDYPSVTVYYSYVKK
jgi:hypothetical protein